MPEPESIGIPMEHVVGEDVTTRYVTELVVQHTPGEFLLSFFEVRGPILLGSDEERKKAVESIDKVEARCRARVVIPAWKMPAVLKALNENFQTWQDIYTAEDSDL